MGIKVVASHSFFNSTSRLGRGGYFTSAYNLEVIEKDAERAVVSSYETHSNYSVAEPDVVAEAVLEKENGEWKMVKLEFVDEL